MDDITMKRYQPRGPGIVDTKHGRFHGREYGPGELIDEVNWLNEREAGYPPKLGAIKA